MHFLLKPKTAISDCLHADAAKLRAAWFVFGLLAHKLEGQAILGDWTTIMPNQIAHQRIVNALIKLHHCYTVYQYSRESPIDS